MEKKYWRLLFNPFERIAGWQALAWGILGLIISTALSYLTNYHYHGLLHFGSAPNNALWCYVVEHLVVWLIPFMLFYLGGIMLSKSNIRLIDVLGTVVFAQLPLIISNLFFLLPPFQKLMEIDTNMPLAEMIIFFKQPEVLLAVWLSLVSVIFLIWTLVWMFNALKVSTNLKGYPLGILYCVGVFGGDIICRYLIKMCY